jgi:hypothetical protein
MRAQCVRIAFTLSYDNHRGREHFGKVIQNLTWVFLPNPTPAPVWIARSEILGFVSDNFVEETSFVVSIGVRRYN